MGSRQESTVRLNFPMLARKQVSYNRRVIMKNALKLLNISMVGVWGILLITLFYMNSSDIPPEKTLIPGDVFDKKAYWYGIYVGDKKIGFASTTIDKVGQEIIIKHEREMKVLRDGKENLLLEILKCLTDEHFSIKYIEYASHFNDEKGIKVTGTVDSGEIIFFLESPEKRRTHKTKTGGVFYLPITFLPIITRDNPAPHKAFSVPSLNISSLSIDTVQVVLEEIRPLKVGINISSLYKFRTGDTIWWCNEKGDILKEKKSMGVILYSQVEPFAKDPADRILFDYTELPVIKANRILADSEALNSLKVRIKNFKLNPEIYGNSPVTFTDDILTIRKRTMDEIKGKNYQLPYKEGTYMKYTQPDEWVLSTYKPLSDTGRSYAKSLKFNAVPFVRYLTGYLSRLIKTMPSFVLSNSEQILKSLSGDYSESTVMFTTYARAAGLPTRLVGGLVYRDGYFYFHTWPEVWLQEWIPVDPVFSQFPADVTHIPLKEGTLKDITSIVQDLQAIKIEILETS